MTTVTCFFCCDIFVSILCDLLLTDNVKYSKMHYVKKKKQGVENMKKWSFLNKFVLIAGLLFASQVFAAECVDGTKWGDFTTTAATDSDGNGYYEIDTPEKLAWFACVTTRIAGNYLKMKVELTSDIDLGGNLFIPISEHEKGGNKFAGAINGQGHTIRGLFIKGTEIIKTENGGKNGYAQNIGLVSVLTTGGVIENLVLEVSDIYASASAGGTGSQGSSTSPVSVGTLVGWMEGGTIRNCVVEGSITTSGSKNRVGGLAGNVWSATITDCVSNVSISANGSDTHVGGVVGALRKGGTVNLASCVFDGDTLISTGGTAGGIVGYHEDATVYASNLYYTGDYPGTGKPKAGVTIPTSPKADDELNSEEVVCGLNGGSWNSATQICSGDTSNVWSEGVAGISMNGSDGYKVSFDANGGSFGSGAKTFKIFVKGATITADEITAPTLTNKKFAGWATTANAEKPTELGVADANKTLYAVWYDFYTVTFKLADTVSYSISVPKHGHVSMESFTVPSSYKEPDAESEGDSIKYYFTGWGPEAKWLGFYIDPSTGDTVKIDPTPDDTLHLASIDVLRDTTLYPVWTRAETYSVTFDATLHGKTHVRFVKKVNQGDAVEEPDDVVTNPGYKIIGWCTNENTAECSEYDFDAPLTKNLTLYAEWDTLSYEITYVMNGGTNDGSNPSTYTVQSDTIIFAEPTYAGYTFEGWFYDADFTEPATGIATNSTTGDKTLYARWTRIIYTIEYLSGNDVSATIVADKKYWNESLTLKGEAFALVREGYVHKGWSTTENGPLAYDFGDTYDKNEDEILFPYWVESCDSVKYGAVTIYTYAVSGRVEAVIDGSSMDEIDIPEGFGVDTVIYNRTFEAGKHSTIVLPFSIGVNDVDGATFYELARVTKQDGKWKDVEVYAVESGTLTANTPYIVTTTGSTVTFKVPVSFESTQTLDTAIVDNGDDSHWEFRGTYKEIVFGNLPEIGRAYGFAAEEKDGAHIGNFVKAGPLAWMRPMRAYLVYEPAAENSSGKVASMFDIPEEMEVLVRNEKDEVVERGVLNTRTGEIRMDSWYDLQGRKLNRKPQTQGTYYHNGSRVIVK